MAGGLFRRPGLGGVRRDQTDHRRLLGFYLLTRFPAVHNTEPVQQFVSVFDNLVPGWLALTLAVVLGGDLADQN